MSAPDRPVTRKSLNLIREARVTITSLSAGTARADVRCPNTGRVVVVHTDAHWSCTCLRGGVCNHILAVAVVTDMVAPVPPGVVNGRTAGDR